MENCLAGYNSCIFAYGHTGSGKTFTMLGPQVEEGHQSQVHSYAIGLLAMHNIEERRSSILAVSRIVAPRLTVAGKAPTRDSACSLQTMY